MFMNSHSNLDAVFIFGHLAKKKHLDIKSVFRIAGQCLLLWLSIFTVNDVAAQNFADSFIVTPSSSAEDNIIEVSDFLQPGPAFTNGGSIADIIGIDVAAQATLAGSTTLTYNGLTPTSATIYIYGASSGVALDKVDENAYVAEIYVNLEQNTYSGQAVLLDLQDSPSFSWIDHDLGSAVSNASLVSSSIDSGVFDITVSQNGNELIVEHSGTLNGVSQLAMLASYEDYSSDSITLTNSATQVLVEQGDDDDLAFPIDINTDIIEVVAFGGDTATDARVESMLEARFFLIRQDDNRFTASGIANVIEGNGGSLVATWATNGSEVPGDLTTTSGLGVIRQIDQEAPIGDSDGNTETSSDNGDAQITRLGPAFYFDGAGNLVITQRAEIDIDWSVQWLVRQYERSGATAPIVNVNTATLIDQTDPVNTLNLGSDGSGNAAPEQGGYFRIEVPIGSTAGKIRLLEASTADRFDPTDEDRFALEILIDFSDGTSSGSSIGRRLGAPDYVTWSNIPFGTKLVTDSGLAQGVISNHENLTTFSDAHVGGIVIDFEVSPDGDSINYITVAFDGPGNDFSFYNLANAFATWDRLEQARILNISELSSVSGGQSVFDPSDNSVVIPVFDLINTTIEFDPADNYNGTLALGIERANDPTISGSVDIELISNTDPRFDANNDGVDIGAVDEALALADIKQTDTEISGSSIFEILSGSAQDGSANRNSVAIISALSDDLGGTGEWQYSLDGVTWFDIDTATTTSALLLDNDDLLRYIPSGGTQLEDNVTNNSAALSILAWDGSGTEDGNGSAMIAGNRIDVNSIITDGSSMVLSQTSDQITQTLIGAIPPTVSSIQRQLPTNAQTGADEVTFRLTFSEGVLNLDSSDLSLSGTAAADGTIGSVTEINASTYDIVVSGLDESNGTINLDLNPGQDITDLSNNALIDISVASEEEYILFNPGDPSSTNSTLNAVAEQMLADGTSTTSVTVQIIDDNGVVFIEGGESVSIQTSLGSISNTIDNGDGTYSAILTSASSVGTAIISATINGDTISATDTVEFIPGALVPSNSVLTADADSIVANGVSTTLLTIQALDATGNRLVSGGAAPTFSTASGQISDVTDNGDGTYTGTLTSSTVAGATTVSASLNGESVANTVEIFFIPGEATTEQSQITSSANSIVADGASTTLITVTLRDAFGNALTSGGELVQFNTDSGSLSTVSDNNDGTYSASLTSSTSIGSTTVTATLNGNVLANSVTVIFSVGAADTTQSQILSSETSIVANGVSSSNITVILNDEFGNPLSSGGDAVQLSTNLGSLSAVSDNNNGTYTATLSSSNVSGSATVSATINGDTLASTVTIVFVAGEASPAQSQISASESAIVADGVSTATITVSLNDEFGNSLTVGGDSVQLSTDLGLLSTVVDNGDGLYTATLTSATTSGVANVIATVNNSNLASSASVAFVPGPLIPSNSVLSAASSQITANGSSTTTLSIQAKDAQGNDLEAGGAAPVFISTLGEISNISDNNDGTYTATLTSGTASGSATISASLDGEAVANTVVVEFIVGNADSNQSQVTASETSIIADGLSTAMITVTLNDAFGNPLNSGGDAVLLSTTSGSLSTVSDNGDGTYTATLTSATSTGIAVVNASVNGDPQASSASVAFVPGPLVPANSVLSAADSQITANGTTSTSLSIQAKDANSNDLDTGGATPAFISTLGEISNTTDNNDGTYTATLTSGTDAGSATISASLNGEFVANTVVVEFIVGDADSNGSQVTVSEDTIIADGVSTTTVTVTLNDAFGNPLDSGGDIVQITASSGSLSPVSDNGDGTYTATLTSTTSIAVATVSAIVNGNTQDSTVSVNFIPGPLVPSNSVLTAASLEITANGLSSTSLNIQAKDANNNDLDSGGAIPAFTTTLGEITNTVDNNDGTYTATLTSSTDTGNATVSATLNNEAVANTLIVAFVADTATSNQSLITSSEASLITNGLATAVITVTLLDELGNPLNVGGDLVELTADQGTLSSVSDNNDGTYTATYTAPAASSINNTATISARINVQDGPSVVIDLTPDPAGDDDQDGLTNNEEQGGDSDNDGLPDILDSDDDNDGILTLEEGNIDTDGDGTPDHIDLDSDNDGVIDKLERGDVSELSGLDTDNDGIDDALDVDVTGGSDANNNGIDDTEEARDSDGDGTADYQDTDSDNDSIPDIYEANTQASLTAEDSDSDGIDDAVDADFTGGADSNSNGVDDAFEALNSDSDDRANHVDPDSDNDGIPDLIEASQAIIFSGEDSDLDGIDDFFDVDQSGGDDTNNNGFDDQFEPQDTDSDGLRDYLDIDSDNDGILDSAEADSTGLDSDGDGLDDLWDIDQNGGTLDTDANDIDDALEVTDTDGDTRPDYLDLDSDNDSLLDAAEAGSGVEDANGDGFADSNITTATPLDSDNDGLPDYRDIDSDADGINDIDGSGSGALDADNDGRIDNTSDADADGIADVADGDANVFGSVLDTDGDGIPDNEDVDIDGDGIPNASEEIPLLGIDSDNDGIDDAIDVDETGGIDEDADGIDDGLDGDADNDGLSDSSDTDSDGDGIPDFIEAGDDPLNPVDSDNDGRPDFLDEDADNDGIHDADEVTNLPELSGSDSDLDGIDDALDVDQTGGSDTNNNGIDDAFEPSDQDGDGLADSLDRDSDGDHIPDLIEGVSDTDEDGIPDFKDIDSDNDGIPDIIEAVNIPALSGFDIDSDGIDDNIDVDFIENAVDENSDGIADSLGLTDTDNDGIVDNRDRDSDDDGIPDALEANNIAELLNTDTDVDGFDDAIDVDETGGSDINNDSIDDAFYPVDTDGDGVPDFLDIDADSDGIIDEVEADTARSDSDNDGIEDNYDVDQTLGNDLDSDGVDDDITATDTDDDTIPDYLDLDSDNDGISDVLESGLSDNNLDSLADFGMTTDMPIDTDDDGIPDYRDLDSNNDTIVDIIEGGNGDLDTDLDGMIDEPSDSDGDGIPDVIDSLPDAFGTDIDSDMDGISDSVDLDDDNDGISDEIENNSIPQLRGVDSDLDGIDDAIDVTATGGDDLNQDGIDDTADGDTDDDNIPDRLDLDSDNDGIPDIVESGIDGLEALAGRIDPSTFVDSDGDGLDDSLSVDEIIADTDEDGIADFRDLDSDDDGLSDLTEGGSDAATLDQNSDGVIDAGVDLDEDGLVDAVDSSVAGTSSGNPATVPDTDADGIADFIDTDSDGDGLPDMLESGNDLNNNGIPDNLETDNAQLETAVSGAGSSSTILLVFMLALCFLNSAPRLSSAQRKRGTRL